MNNKLLLPNSRRRIAKATERIATALETAHTSNIEKLLARIELKLDKALEGGMTAAEVAVLNKRLQDTVTFLKDIQ